MRRTIFLLWALALVAASCGGADAGTTTQAFSPTATTVSATTSSTSSTTSSSTSSTTITTALLTGPNISNDSVITIGGLGPVRVGMTPEEATVAAGYVLAVEIGLFEGDSCYYLPADPYVPGVSFMVNNGTVARVDVLTGPVTTRSGAGIGMTEPEIRNLFPGKIQQQQHPYIEGGKYLEFVPVDEVDLNFRVVFETDPDGVVLTYRAGRLPEVRWVEGCA